VSGVRGSTTDRVITGVSGSPGSLRALRFAVDIARTHDAVLIPALAWVPPGGDLADRRYPSAYLRKLWAEAATERLAEAVDLALGGVPADVVVRPAVLRGEAARVLVTVASEPGDVLVIGAGRRGGIRRMSSGGVARFCLAHAGCPVIAVPPSGLEEASRGLRGWALRHRSLDSRAAALHAAGSR
jgi:nucleotide-binding universal stress UspA family protein